jgi:2-oxoglutarate ferredoxin oxidoreductase subunit alpha
MLDLDIGMNHRLCRPLKWDDARQYDRGKIMTAEMLDEGRDFGRYLDVDGDGIPYRTLPGTHATKGSYFTRGTSRDRYARYSEEGPVYADNMQRLVRKFETAQDMVPRPLQVQTGGSAVGIVAFGSSDFAVLESRDQLKKEYGLETDYLRLRAYPFAAELHEFVAAHERIYVVEQNRDAQLLSLMKLDLPAADAVKLHSIRHFNGLPMDARSVTDELVTQEGI